jgi:hypothetical protein
MYGRVINEQFLLKWSFTIENRCLLRVSIIFQKRAEIPILGGFCEGLQWVRILRETYACDRNGGNEEKTHSATKVEKNGLRM